MDGFVRRYATSHAGEVDGLPAGEGVFLACTFWLADNYLLRGRRKEARQVFERLLSVANDVGLLAEEYDPREKVSRWPVEVPRRAVAQSDVHRPLVLFERLDGYPESNVVPLLEVSVQHAFEIASRDAPVARSSVHGISQ